VGGEVVVDASAYAALTWVDLPVGVAVPVAGGPAVPGADQAEATCVALVEASSAQHGEAYGVPVAAASIDPAVDEVDSAVVEAGSVVADAVLGKTVVSDKAACVGHYQLAPTASGPCSCPPVQLELCFPPVPGHHLKQLPLPQRRQQQHPLCEVYHVVDRCRLASWPSTASLVLAGAKVDLLQRPMRSGPPCGDDHASASWECHLGQ